MSMDIQTAPGEYVRFANPNNGLCYDQEQAKKYLVEGETYQVHHTNIDDWFTEVWLVDKPIAFNSVMFDNIETQK